MWRTNLVWSYGHLVITATFFVPAKRPFIFLWENPVNVATALIRPTATFWNPSLCNPCLLKNSWLEVQLWYICLDVTQFRPLRNLTLPRWYSHPVQYGQIFIAWWWLYKRGSTVCLFFCFFLRILSFFKTFIQFCFPF